MTFQETLAAAEAELLATLREEEIHVGTTVLGMTREEAVAWGDKYGGEKRREIHDFIARCRAVGMMLTRHNVETLQ